MDNIIIIDEWTQTTFPNNWLYLLPIGIGFAFLFGILAIQAAINDGAKINKAYHIFYASMCILCILVGILGVVLYANTERETTTYYKVMLSDDVSANEFVSKYNIIKSYTSKTGQVIYTVTVK